MPMHADVLIVGAGIAGLSCAQLLSRAGARVTLLEKSRGVGGRCATRRIEGQPVDHGVAFLHGNDRGFLAALDDVAAERIEGWPRSVAGVGAPCRPAAFAPGERRLAFVAGLTRFPKRLAAGLDVRLGERVVAVRPRGDVVEVESADGSRRRAATIVLATPAPQALELLRGMPRDDPTIGLFHALLPTVNTVSCLTLMAGYPAEGASPGWEMAYPEDSRILQLISHDSSKRADPTFRVLVCQGRWGWSRRRWDAPASTWLAEALAEAARIAGTWAAEPAWARTHRWRHAQVSRASELGSPLLLTLDGGGSVGVTGDGFAWGGGVQAAWKAGRAMAGRLLGERGEWT